MADHIRISTESIDGAARVIVSLCAALNGVHARLGNLSFTETAGANLAISGKSSSLVSVGGSVRPSTAEQTVRQCSAALSLLTERTARLSKNLRRVSASFAETESGLAGKFGAAKTGTAPGGVNSGVDFEFKGMFDRYWTAMFTKLKGTAGISGSLFGMGAGLTAEGSLLGLTFETSGKAKFDLDKGDVLIGEEYKAKFHVAEGKLSGNIGLLSGSATVTALTMATTGKIGASLFKDGKFAPSLYAKEEASVSVLEGKAEGQFGTDEFNAHTKASGKILTAKAEAGVEAGVVSYTDESGKTKTAFGVSAKAGAEAYVAEGKISGGFSLFGIKFDLEASGKAGGGGVSAGGSITTKGVSGKIGAGLGLGAGLAFNIDWSGFKL